jgi:hypothetical protein
MLSPVESAQPRGTGWLIVGCPTLFLSVIAFLELGALDPRIPLSGETLSLWVVLLIIIVGVLLPLWRVPRTVTVDEGGATVQYYTGERRRVAWTDVADIALLGAEGGPLASTELVRIRVQKGRIIQVTNRMSNFQQFKSLVCRSWVGPLRRQPTAFERFLLNAKRTQR